MILPGDTIVTSFESSIFNKFVDYGVINIKIRQTVKMIDINISDFINVYKVYIGTV